MTEHNSLSPILDCTYFSLEYNSGENWLLEQSLIESKNVLHNAHIKLLESNKSQRISIVQ